MQYNYSFEAASLLFMVLIFVHFMVVWQFPTEKTRVFRALLIVCIGESVFNILSSIGLANAGVVPQIVNEILAFVFFSFEGLSSLMIYKYMVVISELDQRQKKWAVSAALNTVHRVLLLFSGWSVSSGQRSKFRIFLYHAVFCIESCYVDRKAENH